MIALGIPEDTVSFPWREAVLKNIEVSFSMSSSYTSWDKALNMLSQDGDLLSKVVTGVLPLEQWERAFSSLLDEKDTKIILTVH